MAQSTPTLVRTFITATDMSSTNYRAVILSDDLTVADAGANGQVIGIRQESPDGTDNDTNVNVSLSGTSKLTLGGTVTVGAYIKSTSTGAGEATTTNTDIYFARALEAGVTGDVIEVLIERGTLST